MLVHILVKEIELGNELDKTSVKLWGQKVSGDMWEILIDKSESDECDEITLIPEEEGMRVYEVRFGGSPTSRGWVWPIRQAYRCTPIPRRGIRSSRRV
jgi:hypothetical protein